MNIENELDLESLFQPAWAKQPVDANQYARYTGQEGAERERRGDRPFRGGSRPGGERRDRPPGGGGGPRPQGQGGPRGPRPEGDRGPRRDGPGRGPGGPGGPRGDFRGGPRRDDRREDRRPELPPALELNFTIVPEEKGVDSLAKQIKLTGRAYPLFDIAQLIVQKPERYQIKIETKKNADGTVAQPLFTCALDDTVWLSEQEAVSHILQNHFATFYQAEKTPCDAPKGVYTFVAQCGISGVVLGPPNYHDYQNQLRRLHQTRFERMPFDMFKSRVKIVKDEAVVKKWIEDQSFKTEYVALNLPEPLRLSSMEEVQRHFREVHVPNIVKQVNSLSLSGVASRDVRQPALQRNLRHLWEQQRRFPLAVVNILSSQLASRGLQFFKVNKTVTHVSVARPHFLDVEANPVSVGVRKIVDFINVTPKSTRKTLLDALAPSAPAPTPAPAVETPAPVEGSAPTEGAPAAEAPAPAPAPVMEATPEQRALIGDLHWLIHQGHVIEFHNGILETAKKPVPKPVQQPKKEKAPKPAPAAPAQDAAPVAENAEAPASEAPTAEIAAAPVAETAPEAAPATETAAAETAPVKTAPEKAPEPPAAS